MSQELQAELEQDQIIHDDGFIPSWLHIPRLTAAEFCQVCAMPDSCSVWAMVNQCAEKGMAMCNLCMLYWHRTCCFLPLALEHGWSLGTQAAARRWVAKHGVRWCATPTQLLLTRLGRLLAEHPPSGPQDEVVSVLEALSSLQVRM